MFKSSAHYPGELLDIFLKISKLEDEKTAIIQKIESEPASKMEDIGDKIFTLLITEISYEKLTLKEAPFVSSNLRSNATINKYVLDHLGMNYYAACDRFEIFCGAVHKCGFNPYYIVEDYFNFAIENIRREEFKIRGFNKAMEKRKENTSIQVKAYDYVSILNSFKQKGLLEYIDESSEELGVHTTIFHLSIAGFSQCQFFGESNNKKDSDRMAAEKAIEFLLKEEVVDLSDIKFLLNEQR